MTHHIVHIKASPKQLSKLRKGHKVRISAAVEGEGFNLLVDPSRYDTLSRTFNRGKGMEIATTHSARNHGKSSAHGRPWYFRKTIR